MPDPENKEAENEKVAADLKEALSTIEDLKSKSGDAENYTLAIDGENKTFTLEELKEAAQTSAGANAKFEKAAEMVKNATPGLEISRLAQELRESKSPDSQVQKDFLHALGVSQEQIDGMLKITEPTKKEGKKATDDGKKGTPVTLDNLGPRERQIMEDAERRQYEQIRTDIKNSCEKSVDNDKVLGKMVDGMPDKRRSTWLGTAKRLLNKDVERRILAREEYGPDMIATSLQTVRAVLEEIGVPSKVAGQPPLVGLDYASVLGPEIHAAEPIKRVAVDDSKYFEVAAARLQQKLYANQRKALEK